MTWSSRTLSFVWGLPLVLTVLTTSLPAFAHLMPSKQGTINLVGDAAFAVLSVPVAALHGFDDDQDGLLSAPELQRHLATLEDEIDRRFVLLDGDAVGTTVTITLVPSPQHEASRDTSDHVVVLKHAQFAAFPKDLRVQCDLFGARASEQELSITATRPGADGTPRKETEVLTFTPAQTERRFFQPLLQALARYVVTGARHVLLGPDHLLFLLTVIVAGVGWRYWLRVVTAFTVAHSITLAAAMLGYIRLSPRVVEPLIAVSILAMALDNLLRPTAPQRQRIALVCAFGLLHGLGFASSMDAMGLDPIHKLSSLVGFNLGVEIGQGIFLVGVLVLLDLVRRAIPRMKPVHVARAVSLVAVAMGSAWMIQRIVF